MATIVFFLGGIALVVAVLLATKIRDLKKFGKEPKLKNVPGGILMVMALALILTAVFLFLAPDRAEAEERKPVYKDHKIDIDYFSYTSLYVGVDYDWKNQVFCKDPKPDIVKDKKWTSNININQNLVTIKHKSKKLLSEFNLRLSHHSCAVNQDAPTYDSVGIGYLLRVDW